MADHRDDMTTHTTTTGARPEARPEYRDPRTTTTVTTRRSRGTSWIGIIIAVLAIIVIGAWWAGGFDGRDETAMMVGEPAAEAPATGTAENGTDAVIVAPVDEAPAETPAAPADDTTAPAQPVQQ